jgi:hypothetical protein
VGLTGVIYAMIVVAWAAYLVPMALRRHDEAVRGRSVERFSAAMRVLARRGNAGTGRVVVTPNRDAGRMLGPGQAADSAEDPPRAPLRRPSRHAMRVAAARRRRVLALLLACTAGTGAASALSVAPRWSSAAPAALVVVFLLVARRSVRRASESYWAVQTEAAAGSSNVVRRAAARVDASHGAPRVGSGRGFAESPVPDDEPTVPIGAAMLEAADLAEGRVVAVPLPTSGGGSLWDPLPVTLPTYVEKPVARRSLRTIDVGEPGTWSSGHSNADSEPVAGAAGPGDVADGVAKRDAEPPRAVNG